MATYTAIVAGGDWNTAATWGGTGVQYPHAGDTATLNATSGNVTVGTPAACAIVNCTGYAGNLTLNAGITTTGAITLPDGVGSLFTPNTQTWISAGNVTIKTNGKIFYNLLIQGGGGGSLTLSDDCHCSNIFSGGTTTGFTILTSDVYCYGLTNDGANNISGTRTIFIHGGTWSHTGAAGSILCNIAITGSVIISGQVYYGGQTLTSLTASGAILSTTGSTLNFVSSCSFNDTTMQWATVNAINSITVTLTQPSTTVKHLTTSATKALIITNGVAVTGNLTLGSTSSITGSTITMTGATAAATWSCDTGYVGCNLTFLGGGNTIKISGTVNYRTGTLTYTSGVMSFVSTPVLNISASCTLNTSGMTWPTITNSASVTVTLGSDLHANSVVFPNLSLFAGSFNCYFDTYQNGSSMIRAGASNMVGMVS